MPGFDARGEDRSWPYLVGFLAFLAMTGACVVVGYAFGLFGPLFKDLSRLVTGDYAEIRPSGGGVPMMIACAMALAALALPATAIGLAVMRLAGSLKETDRQDDLPMFKSRPGNPAPTGFKALVIAVHKLATVVLFEEFYARWLLLGAIGGLAWFDGTVGFYVLFLGGNAAWALLHLMNFREGRADPLKVLPQFIGGFFSTVMFLRYGLAGAFAEHLAWDLLVILPTWIAQTCGREPLTL